MPRHNMLRAVLALTALALLSLLVASCGASRADTGVDLPVITVYKSPT